MMTLFVSCGGLDGTYIAKNDTAKQGMYQKFIFKGGKVRIIMGTMGIQMPGGYEYGFKRDGDKISIELGVPGTAMSLGGIELHYNEKADEISLLLGGDVGTAMNEYAPVWGKEGSFDPNNPYPDKNGGQQGSATKPDNNLNPDNNNTSNVPDKSVVTGTFTYSGGDIANNKVDDYETDFIFSTEYFNKPANEYNHELSIMSLQLAMATFGSHNQPYGEHKADNTKELLTKMGFSNIEPHGYETEPQENSIAVTFASDSLDSKTELLVIAVRGGEYKEEWGGNFNVGNGDVHEGFRIAKEKIRDYFDVYIRTHKNELSNKNTKLWITGYSRGAAVANLLSVYFDDNVRDNSSYGMAYTDNNNILTQVKLLLKKSDIYSYCFATPNNSKTAKPNDDNYNNIISIICPFDPVPRFPFQGWNFYRYGTYKFLPNPNSTTYNFKSLEQKMLTELNGLDSKGSSKKNSFKEVTYFIDDFHFHQGNTGKNSCSILSANIYDIGRHSKIEESMDKYLDNFVNGTLQTLFGRQGDYVKNKQSNAIVSAMSPDKDGQGDVKGFMGALTGTLNLGDEIIIGLGGWGNNNDNIATLGPSKNFLEKLRLGDDNVCHVDKDDRFPAVYRFNEGGEYYDGKVKNGQSRKDVVIQMAEEARNNSYAVTSGHYPELYLAWLKSLPTNWDKIY